MRDVNFKKLNQTFHKNTDIFNLLIYSNNWDAEEYLVICLKVFQVVVAPTPTTKPTLSSQPI